MVELTIDQALQQGVEAHKAGQVQKADRLYTAILKAQPDHPDANHNLGVLAVGVGKVEQALPFFKTALEAHPATAQFWLSYIGTLIKLDKLTDAQAVLDQAKSKGAKGDGFDKLELKLQEKHPKPLEVRQVAAQIRPEQQNILDSLKLEQAFSLAKKKSKQGAPAEAECIYQDILVKFPKNKRALAGLKGLSGGTISKVSKFQEPLQNQVQSLINLYSQGRFQQVLEQTTDLLQQFPKSSVLLNMQGAVLKGLGQLNQSVEAYNKALAIKPYYAEAHYNMGITLKDQGKLEEAIEAYNKAVAIKPDYADAYYNLGNALTDQDKLEEAIEAYNKALAIKLDYAEAYYNMAVTLQKQGKLDEAIMAYNKTLEIKPDYAEAYNTMGITLQKQGKIEEAIKAYNKALEIKPKYAEADNNMGGAFQEQGKLEKAIEAYNKALATKPYYADAYNNMGNVLQKQGKLEEAIEAYNKALEIKPNNPAAYNNKGNALREQGKLEGAKEAYNKALEIKPDYADPLWNLSGTAENISEAKKWIERCLMADPRHLSAKLTLSALQFYESDKSEFNTLMQSSLKDNPFMRSFAWAFELPKLPELFFHKWALFDRMVELSKKDRPFYEFGVWRGVSFQYLIKTFKKGYGFDTFEGIPEDWHDEEVGTYSSDGCIPQIEGGEFIVGKFDDTLAGFFAEPRPKASIINFDADLYSSTIRALDFAKSVIDPHSILIFDEFLMNENWEQDEYKALNEFCYNNNYTYEVIAISFLTKQVAVRLVGI